MNSGSIAHEQVRLEPVPAERRGVLEQLLELHAHDLSDIFPIEPDDHGRFGYPPLALYWSAPDTRHAFLVRCGERIAGFVLVTRGSPATDDPSDFDVAEFFILRGYRRRGVGRRAAFALWNQLPGRWVVRVAEANGPAVRFWRDVVREYTAGSCTQTGWDNNGRAWRVLSFEPPIGRPDLCSGFVITG